MKKLFSVLAVVAVMVFGFLFPAISAELNRGAVVLTFDDGSNDLLPAIENMAKYNLVGTIYPVTTRISSEEVYMSWDQIRDLHWKGWEMGNHTASHISLVGLPDIQIYNELIWAQSDLNANGIPGYTVSLAPPFGEFDDRVINIVKLAGFTSSRQAWMEDSAFNKPTDFNQWAVNVKSLRSTTSISELKTLIGQAANEKSVLVFVIHGAAKSPADEYQMKLATFEKMAKYINSLRSQGVLDVLTMSKAVEKLLYYKKLP